MTVVAISPYVEGLPGYVCLRHVAPDPKCASKQYVEINVIKSLIAWSSPYACADRSTSIRPSQRWAIVRSMK